jgi:V8-like Glu-specific endopeptidase
MNTTTRLDSRLRAFRLAALASLSLALGCLGSEADVVAFGDEASVEQIALGLAAASPTVDIAGVRYNLVGKAKFATTTAEEIAKRMESRGVSVQEFADGRRVETFPAVDPADDISKLSVSDLAGRLRGRALSADGYEYLEATPPMEMAMRIKADMEAGRTPPSTEAGPEVGKPLNAELDGRQGRYILGSDTRALANGLPTSYKYQIAMMNANHTQLQCSMTMISSKVAATAAHCLWNGSGWTLPQQFVPFARNTTPTQPFGTLTYSWIRLPSNSTGPGNDYAYVEFSDSAAKNLSWLGTEDVGNAQMGMEGYPGDKPIPQLWAKYGGVTENTSTRRKHNLDIVPGDSGSALYNVWTSRLVGIQSTQNRSRTCFAWICGSWTYWNEAERWRSTTYNFFDAGNWPD